MRGRGIVLLATCLAFVACDKKPSTSSVATADSSSSAEPLRAPASWYEPLKGYDGKGWFDVVTLGPSSAAPISGRACAFWSIFYEGKMEAAKERVSSDEWPGDAIGLVVDGRTVPVPESAIEWELPPTTKTFTASDANAPAKVEKILTSKSWMGNDDEALPKTVEATERCLAPATKYRAELRKKEEQMIWGEPNVQTGAPTAGGAAPKVSMETVWSLAIAAK